MYFGCLRTRRGRRPWAASRWAPRRKRCWAAYPSAQLYAALQPSRPVSFDRVYVWEPGGLAYCKHIAFFLKDGIVAAIEVEDLMDGRLLLLSFPAPIRLISADWGLQFPFFCAISVKCYQR